MEATDAGVDNTVAIETTVMAIREQLMQYFKGGSVEELVLSSNIHMFSSEDIVSGFRYPRAERVRQRHVVFIGNYPILSLAKNEDEVMFNTVVLGRSDELEAIGEQLLDFFRKYLPGVLVKYNKGAVCLT